MKNTCSIPPYKQLRAKIAENPEAFCRNLRPQNHPCQGKILGLKAKLSDLKSVQFFKNCSSAPLLRGKKRSNMCSKNGGKLMPRNIKNMTRLYPRRGQPSSKKITPEFPGWGHSSSGLRKRAVMDVADWATCSGVPLATTWPPPRPPSGPMSMM